MNELLQCAECGKGYEGIGFPLPISQGHRITSNIQYDDDLSFCSYAHRTDYCLKGVLDYETWQTKLSRLSLNMGMYFTIPSDAPMPQTFIEDNIMNDHAHLSIFKKLLFEKRATLEERQRCIPFYNYDKVTDGNIDHIHALPVTSISKRIPVMPPPRRSNFDRPLSQSKMAVAADPPRGWIYLPQPSNVTENAYLQLRCVKRSGHIQQREEMMCSTNVEEGLKKEDESEVPMNKKRPISSIESIEKSESEDEEDDEDEDEDQDDEMKDIGDDQYNIEEEEEDQDEEDDGNDIDNDDGQEVMNNNDFNEDILLNEEEDETYNPDEYEDMDDEGEDD